MANERALWEYFREIQSAVSRANRGEGAQPYRSGTFLVTAVAGDVEFTISDITEEDGVLVAADLRELGANVVLCATVVCPSCAARVPEQEFCVQCRARLERVHGGGR